MEGLASSMYWADRTDNHVEVIFNSPKNMFTGFQSKELAIRKTQEKIRDKREGLVEIDEVIDGHLDQADVIHGDFTSGWGGVRYEEVIRYIMYEYERTLRDSSGELSLAPYHEFRQNFQLEHLVPKNARRPDELPNHEENRHRLGNLSVLSPPDNKTANNKSYEQKYEEFYRDSALNQLRNLPEPDFGLDEIAAREADLIPFIKERWGSNQATLDGFGVDEE